MKLIYRAGERQLPIDLSKAPEAGRELEISIDGENHRIEVVRLDRDEIVFRFGGELIRARCAADKERRVVHCAGSFPVAFSRDDGTRKKKVGAGHGGGLEATMHSQVIAVAAVVGARVARGEVLVTLEAMKMEMRIAAPFSGTVKNVSCKAGEVVERGRVLVEIEPDPG
jgi:biotin carboxyl carrier protein